MADFFFFTDIDLLQAQTSDQAFGPLAATDPLYDPAKEQYRLTSFHTATNNPLAYAICDAQILVQEDATNSSLVNIILKPQLQPNNDLPSIKFYIYRGILKNSLTDGVNVIDGGNALTKSILNNNSSSPQKVFGIELTGTGYSDSDSIENAFLQPRTGFELWLVSGGWSIGTFDKNSFGLDIIFNRAGFEPALGSSRNDVNLFEITKLIGTPTQADLFAQKTKKELIINYIDPCAFFGSFYKNSLRARNSTDAVDSNNVPAFIIKSGDEIYREILEGGTLSTPKNNFLNKNDIYLDIRNDLNYSFNYLSNCSDNLKISFIDDNNEPTTVIDYYNSSWPILKISGLPTGNSFTTVKVAFPYTDTLNPDIFINTGTIKMATLDRLKQGNKKWLRLLTDPLNSGLSYSLNSVHLAFDNYNSSIPISNYAQLKYILPFAANDYSASLLPKNDYWDLIVPLSAFDNFNPFTSSLVLKMFNENIYVNAIEDKGKEFINKLGLAQDTDNTYIMMFPSYLRNENNEKIFFQDYSISSAVVENITLNEYLSQKNDNYTFIKKALEITGVSPDPQFLQGIINQPSGFSDNIEEINPIIDASYIVFTTVEFNSLVSQAQSTFSSNYESYIVFENRNDRNSDPSDDYDDNGTPYISYDCSLVGYVEDGIGGVAPSKATTTIKVYGNL